MNKILGKLNHYPFALEFTFFVGQLLLTWPLYIMTWVDDFALPVWFVGLFCLFLTGFYLYVVIKQGKLYLYRLFVIVSLTYFTIENIRFKTTYTAVFPSNLWKRLWFFVLPYNYSTVAFFNQSDKLTAFYFSVIIFISIFGHILYLFFNKLSSETKEEITHLGFGLTDIAFCLVHTIVSSMMNARMISAYSGKNTLLGCLCILFIISYLLTLIKRNRALVSYRLFVIGSLTGYILLKTIGSVFGKTQAPAGFLQYATAFFGYLSKVFCYPIRAFFISKEKWLLVPCLMCIILISIYTCRRQTRTEKTQV